ncbi:MAG: CDP-paratose 2-epimerase [Proteobacteria bacterium]|nr:CDP-paratose 2-epimerase [Pseudomonadota bacterium]
MDEVFSFFSNESNLEALTPPWLNFNVLGKDTPCIQEGTLIRYKLKLYGFPIFWKTRIDSWEPQKSFIDRQLKGPYRQWIHLHEFQSCRGGTLMIDTVEYKVPFGILGELVTSLWVKRDLEKIFNYRLEQADRIFSK